jgi:hypothetical protein
VNVLLAPQDNDLAPPEDNGAVILWETGSGNLLWQVRGHTSHQWERAVAFSPDGKVLATGAGGTIKLWDTATGKCEQPARVHPRSLPIVAAAENVKHRTDVLNWDRLPNITCDMNYRSPAALSPPRGSFAIGWLGFASLVSLLVTYACQHVLAWLLATPQCLMVAIMIGSASLLIRVHLWPNLPSAKSLRHRPVTLIAALLILFMPAYLWLIVVLQWPVDAIPAAILYAVFLATPVVFFAADQIATHAIYYMSANPRIDHATMQAWRNDWHRRFSPLPDRPPRRSNLLPQHTELHKIVMRVRRSYWTGVLWLPCTFLASGLFVLTVFHDSPRHEVGL